MKTLGLKIFCGIFCVTLCLAKVLAAAEEPEKILENAFRNSATQSYHVEVARPFLFRPEITKAVVDRKFLAEDKIYLRMELFEKDRLVETYWRNDDGLFGQIGQTVAQLGISYNLPALEDILLPIPEEEFSHSTWEVEEVTLKGVPGYRIIQTIDPDFRLSQVPNRIDDEKIKHYAVGKRVFLIGVDNILYRRQHYNFLGRLLTEQNLLDAQFNFPFPEDHFASPERTDIHLLSDAKFKSMWQNEQYIDVSLPQRNTSFDARRITRWLLNNGSLLAVGSVVLLLVAWGIHSYKKKK